MRTLIENLCGKLKDWGIDPITLAKAIYIFIALVIIIGLMIKYPVILIILAGLLLSLLLIVLIYSLII